MRLVPIASLIVVSAITAVVTLLAAAPPRSSPETALDGRAASACVAWEDPAVARLRPDIYDIGFIDIVQRNTRTFAAITGERGVRPLFVGDRRWSGMVAVDDEDDPSLALMVACRWTKHPMTGISVIVATTWDIAALREGRPAGIGRVRWTVPGVLEPSLAVDGARVTIAWRRFDTPDIRCPGDPPAVPIIAPTRIGLHAAGRPCLVDREWVPPAPGAAG
jgi:hypothetical protein